MSQAREITDSFVNLVFREAPLILTVWAVCVVVAVLAALLLPKTYEAKATVLVKFGREYIYLPETGNQRATTPQRAGMEEAINSEVQILASRDLAARVIADLGLATLYPDLRDNPEAEPLAVARFRTALDIRAIERSNIINLYFRHRDPQLAADALNRLLELFPLKRLDVYRDSDVPFFRERVGEVEQQLSAAEQRFAEFRTEHGLFDIDAQKRELITRSSRLDSEIADAEKAAIEMRTRSATLGQSMRTEPRTVTVYTDSEQGRLLDEARQKLFELQLRESQLLDTYREDSKAVQAVRREITQIQSFIDRSELDVTGLSTRVGPNEVYEAMRAEKMRVDADLAALEQRLAIARAQRDELRGEIDRITRLEAQYDTRRRQATVLREALDSSLADVADAEKIAAMDQQNRTNIRIVQRATPPAESIGLTRKGRVLLSIPFGLLAGILAAVFLHLVRPAVSEPATAARRTGIDVLATLDKSD